MRVAAWLPGSLTSSDILDLVILPPEIQGFTDVFLYFHTYTDAFKFGHIYVIIVYYIFYIIKMRLWPVI